MGLERRLPAIELIEGNRWLLTLSPRLRRIIAKNVQVMDLKSGETLFRSGDPPDGFFGVLAGEVRLVVNFPNGQTLIGYFASAGDWIGESSILDGLPRMHDASAAGDAVVAWLPQSVCDKLLNEEVEFARAVGLLACRHHRGAIAFANRALTQPVSAQIAYALMSIVRKNTTSARPITLPLRQEDVANIVGASRQTVAPLLKKLAASGAIALGYGSITVLDEDLLKTHSRKLNN